MMKTRKGSLWLAVAAAVLLPAKAKARGRADTSAHRDDPVQKPVYVLAPPIWRRDGRAVAWIERSNGEARVVVIDGVDSRVAPLPLTLPAIAADDRVFWAGQQRIHIGPALLTPRAVATWKE